MPFRLACIFLHNSTIFIDLVLISEQLPIAHITGQLVARSVSRHQQKKADQPLYHLPLSEKIK